MIHDTQVQVREVNFFVVEICYIIDFILFCSGTGTRWGDPLFLKIKSSDLFMILLC